jgi:type II secretory pathway component GspD/PulD (secretin)
MPKNYPEGEIVHRIYDVTMPESFFSLCHLKAYCSTNSTDTDDIYFNQGENLKIFFSEFGVKWPTGSSINYIHGLGKMAVANTEVNQKTFKDLLYRLDIIPYQIEIDLNIVSFKLSEIEKLGSDISAEKLSALRQEGNGTLLAAPVVITQDGQEATVKGVTEYIYPTAFTINSPAGTNIIEAASASIAMPCEFKMREVGTVLNIVPKVSPNGSMINITISSELTHPPECKEYGATFIDANGQQHTARIPQPFFPSQALQTSVIVKEENTVLIGGGMPSHNGKSMVYIFLTARRVGLDGKRLKTE